MVISMEKGYMISDAAKIVEVENHVLRYWEEELELNIPRNEMGHRFYRESDIKLLKSVKELKEQGFQLRAIKKLLPDLSRVEKMDSQSVYRLREELNEQVMQENMERSMGKGTVTSFDQARDRYEKKQNASLERLHQFEAMMSQMIRGTMEEIGRESEERICEQVSIKLQKEMNYLLLQKEELQEKQLVLLHQILEQVKKEETASGEKNKKVVKLPEESGKQIAATQENAPGQAKKKGLFHKKDKGAKKRFAKSL